MDNTQKHNRKNDNLKNRIAKKLNYHLIRIWEDEITKDIITQLNRSN